MLTFPLPYVFGVSKDIEFKTTSVVFQSGKKQVQQNSVNPLITWKIACRGSDEQRKILENFHKTVGGNTQSFHFIDENLEQRTVRFSEPKLSIKVIRDFSNVNEIHGTVRGFTADITLELVL